MNLRLPDDIVLREMVFEAAQVRAWEALLSDEERARYEGFPVAKRRREFLLGRVVLRTLLAEQLGQAPANIPMRLTEQGAVVLPEAPYHVSLSHSRDRAVAVASPRRVGVDLEHVTACSPAVKRFLLRPEERPMLDALPMDRDRAFILCWTLKEATLKAIGTGLRRSPKKVQLDVDAVAQQATTTAWDGSMWRLAFAVTDAYVLSVAYPAP